MPKIKFFSLAILICFLFFIAQATLAIVRHNHFGSFGFDLGLRDQVIWHYSHFKAPITTIHFYPFNSLLTDHVELIYIPLSMLYWIWSSPLMLCIIETGFVCFSGMAIFLLAKEKRLRPSLCIAMLISYLMFYGIQNALWFDVHSASFIATFLAWLVYFFEKKNTKWIIIIFILAIFSKENVASITFLIALVYFIKTKSKISLWIMISSIAYLIFIFGIYFPHFTKDGYRYANGGGLFENITNLQSFYDSSDKRQVIFYSLAWFGFLPLLNPLFLIPAIGDLWNYFVIASNLKAAQGLFMHYRITLAPLLAWATIYSIGRYKWLNNKYIAIYLLVMVATFQYSLHLPLSYLTKQWFWTEPSGVKNINAIIKYLPWDASVVSQNNITPHISQRDKIFTFWPEKKSFSKNSPCQSTTCNWFRWADSPTYLIVDTSHEWDIRHLLANRADYIDGLKNLEKAGILVRHKQQGNAVLYKIIKKS